MGGAQPTLFGSFPLCIQARQRHVAVRLVHVADDGAASALFDEAHAFPDEDCGAKAVVFGNPPAYGVVVEPGGLRRLVLGVGAPGRGDCCEAAFFVPLEGLGGVFAAEFLDQPAVAVVEVAFVFIHPHEVVAHVAFLQVLGALGQLGLAVVVQNVARRVVLEGLAVGGGVASADGCGGEGVCRPGCWTAAMRLYTDLPGHRQSRDIKQFLKNEGFRQDCQCLELQISIPGLFFLGDKWQQEMLLV